MREQKRKLAQEKDRMLNEFKTSKKELIELRLMSKDFTSLQQTHHLLISQFETQHRALKEKLEYSEGISQER